MVMPLTIRVVATSRKTSALLPGCHSRNMGEIRLRIRANITTKIGRLPTIVETRDTSPLAIAQKESIIPSSANASLKASKAIVEFLCFMLLSCLKLQGRIETSKKIPDMQNTLNQSRFQGEM